MSTIEASVAKEDPRNFLIGQVLSLGRQITDAASTGAAWEVWLQVALDQSIRATGRGAVRELSYPPPFKSLRLDLAFQYEGPKYALEMKVESANRAGASVLNAVRRDVVKIERFVDPEFAMRLVLGIAYSPGARAAFYQHQQSRPNWHYLEFEQQLTLVLVEVPAATQQSHSNVDWQAFPSGNSAS